MPLHAIVPILLALAVLLIVLKSNEIERRKARRRADLRWEVRKYAKPND